MNTEKIQQLDATEYGLSKRVSLYKNSDGEILFWVTRKSRFIMKDAKQLLERALVVKEKSIALPLLYISTPLCSKSEVFLESHGMSITKL